MKKSIVFLFVSVLFTVNLFSQTPQHYNANSGGISNTIPFNQPNGYMTQHLIGPGEYTQPTPAPAGSITKFYVYMSSTGGPATYTQLTIKMGQTALTVFPTGSIYTGQLDTVYVRPSVTLSSTASTWLVFTLDRPFNYNPAQSLVIQISHCGYSGSGMSVWQTAGTTGVYRRNNIPGTTSCVFTYSSQDGRILQNGIDIAPPNQAPELLYYKFENNPTATTTPNCAFPGVGTSPAPLTNVTLTPGGQFDSCITGAGVSNGGVATGWNCNFGTGSWTISMWLEATTTTFGYIFGDAGSGSFRCFNNGAAGTNAITLRGTGITNVDVTGFASGPVVVHFVYDSIPHNIKVYKNGVLSATVSQSQLNIATGTGFRVGGYSTSAVFTGKLDEFRVYKRALDSVEIAATWNSNMDCGIGTGVTNGNNNIPISYNLFQNYPNPFNPRTQITFALPIAGNVKLAVFDMLGREIATLVNGYKTAGTHSVDFDASNFASGVYLYKITAGDFNDTKKMVLIK